MQGHTASADQRANRAVGHAVQGLIAIRAPFLYTFDGRPEALQSGQHQVVQQAVMHTFVGQSSLQPYTDTALLRELDLKHKLPWASV